MEMSKTLENLINYYKNLKKKNIVIYDSNGHLYKGKLTYEQLKLKKRIVESNNLQITEGNIIYSFPCLIQNAV